MVLAGWWLSPACSVIMPDSCKEEVLQVPSAVNIMRQIIKLEGSAETKSAKNQLEDMAMESKGPVEEEPSFENPPEAAVVFPVRIHDLLNAGTGHAYKFVLKRNGKYETAFVHGVYMVPKRAT
jgi:hypothetical protein